jgi:alpha-methylacyl-CoA racemase
MSEHGERMRPLDGIRVLDFSTLLPGPLATLLLAEAGAEVIKIERPGGGDEMRSYTPKFGADSVNFALLNRGKRSIALDLKEAGAVDKLKPLLKSADVIVEQFRPGVMDRLGLGYEAISALNPGIIYCAVTGYGQFGPRAGDAAHDLNFVADTGLLDLTGGADGAPVLPAALVADIGGGTYPAVINILLALRERDRSGKGCKLDISMADNLFTFMYWALGKGLAVGEWPVRGSELVTGGSPRYGVYPTKDSGFVAAAPLEDKFWANFCVLIGLPAEFQAADRDPIEVKREVAARIAVKTADEWKILFKNNDVCCSIVTSVEAAHRDPHFAARRVFERRLAQGGAEISALPVPIAERFRASTRDATSPLLGEANSLIE